MQFKILIFICFLSFKTFAQDSSSYARIDSFLNFIEKNQVFSGQLVLRKGNSIIYKRALPIISNKTNLYRVGSVSKMYTAIIIFQLMEEGKLSYNTKLSTFFPQIKNAESINVDNLLSHTSGIYDITNWSGYYGQRERKFTKEEIIKLITDNKPAFKVNEDCSYSNSNYVLLGYIIEEITKKTYAKNIEERITIPLALKNTYAETNDSDRNLREKSYKYNGERWNIDKDSDPSFPGAAGVIISCPEDMTAMINYLFEKQLISDSSLTKMKALKSKSIGHGIFKTPFYEKEGWGHSGRIDEFNSFVGYFPADSLSIGITSNGSRIKLNDLLIGVLSEYYDKDYKYPEFITSKVVDPPSSHFTGKYKAKLFRLITVARFQVLNAGENNLFVKDGFEDTESENTLLERINEYQFYSLEVGGVITFYENKKGKVKGLRLKKGKMSIRCKKVRW